MATNLDQRRRGAPGSGSQAFDVRLQHRKIDKFMRVNYFVKKWISGLVGFIVFTSVYSNAALNIVFEELDSGLSVSAVGVLSVTNDNSDSASGSFIDFSGGTRIVSSSSVSIGLDAVSNVNFNINPASESIFPGSRSVPTLFTLVFDPTNNAVGIDRRLNFDSVLTNEVSSVFLGASLSSLGLDNLPAITRIDFGDGSINLINASLVPEPSPSLFIIGSGIGVLFFRHRKNYVEQVAPD